MQSLINGRSSEDFVFSLDGIRLIAGNTATRALHHALEVIGISRDVQRERGIDFHSWRHFYQSILRGKVSDSDLRHITGHSSQAMTERFTHRTPEHILQYADIQERIFSLLLPKAQALYKLPL
jgi:integrase